MGEFELNLGNIGFECIWNGEIYRGDGKGPLKILREQEAELSQFDKLVAIKDGQVFENGDTIALKVRDKVYTARPEKGDKYDEEKGLMVCLLKAFGIKTKDIENLLARAKGCGSAKKSGRVVKSGKIR